MSKNCLTPKYVLLCTKMLKGLVVSCQLSSAAEIATCRGSWGGQWSAPPSTLHPQPSTIGAAVRGWSRRSSAAAESGCGGFAGHEPSAKWSYIVSNGFAIRKRTSAPPSLCRSVPSYLRASLADHQRRPPLPVQRQFGKKILLSFPLRICDDDFGQSTTEFAPGSYVPSFPSGAPSPF